MERTGGLSTASDRNVDRLESSGLLENRGQGVTILKVRLPSGNKSYLKNVIAEDEEEHEDEYEVRQRPPLRTRRRPRSRYRRPNG